ncbi:hypothetical protein TanjilG_00031 [Lupinus angustifolius]|uniref:Uncharacterized protein n=1 Tax=Lupinus angustifolius TaxID=3871 RepID=A0A4P1QSW1_LUPAN|nr:hypothetical protein TanjilG_00031 [Lupinus angustifolius]
MELGGFQFPLHREIRRTRQKLGAKPLARHNPSPPLLEAEAVAMNGGSPNHRHHRWLERENKKEEVSLFPFHC